jgi:Cu+-exporting ATPase
MRYQLAVVLPSLLVLAGCGTSEIVSEMDGASVEHAMHASTTDTAETTTVAFNVADEPTCSFSVPGMMCEHGCAATVRQVLSEQPGVKEVNVEFESKLATVVVDEAEFDGQAVASLLEDEYGFEDTSLVSSVEVEETPTVDPVAAPESVDASAG